MFYLFGQLTNEYSELMDNQKGLNLIVFLFIKIII